VQFRAGVDAACSDWFRAGDDPCPTATGSSEQGDQQNRLKV